MFLTYYSKFFLFLFSNYGTPMLDEIDRGSALTFCTPGYVPNSLEISNTSRKSKNHCFKSEMVNSSSLTSKAKFSITDLQP